MDGEEREEEKVRERRGGKGKTRRVREEEGDAIREVLTYPWCAEKQTDAVLPGSLVQLAGTARRPHTVTAAVCPPRRRYFLRANLSLSF